MNSIKKQLKNIIKEAILAEMVFETFGDLHKGIDNVADQMNRIEKAQLLQHLGIAISEFDVMNHLLKSRVSPAEDKEHSANSDFNQEEDSS